MRSHLRIPVVLPLLLCAAAAACAEPAPARPAAAEVRPAADARAAAVHRALVRDADALRDAVAVLDSAARAPRGGSSATRLRTAFAGARAAYKRVEPFAELYAPATAEALNGPALDRVEEDDPTQTVIPPEGFQVVEELLFPELSPDTAALREETGVLRHNTERLRALLATRSVTGEHVFDALRQQVARVVVLGLSGFDSPVALRSLPEAAAAFAGIRAALQPYAPALREKAPALARRLDARLAAAVAALEGEDDFDGFDRLDFITRHADPVARDLWAAREALGIAAPAARRPWRGEAATLFERGAFDPRGFAPAYAPEPSAEQAELGRLLFFDPVLSGGGERSCASCHLPERAFTDGRARSLPLDAASGAVIRNAPTVIGAGLQAGTFADLRTTFLEDQVADVVRNRDEMHGELDRAVAALRRSPGYAARFARAFGGSRGGPAVTGARVRGAVAAYVRSLEGLDSRFDRHLRGEGAALSESERRGFNLFMGKAKCGTCHFAPLFNGTVPPAFTETETEVLGVPARPAVRDAGVDPDPGRLRVTRIPLHRHAFKTPTVRNAALSAPYMHNGVYATLEEVVDFYDRGGGAGIGIALENQTLPPDALRLTAAEKRQLVAFMRALTDTTGMTARPARLPSLGDARLDARRVGGRY